MNDLGIPNELMCSLPKLRKYIENRDEYFLSGRGFDELEDELRKALSTCESPQPVPGGSLTSDYWIDKSAKIRAGVFIEGPCIVCQGAEIGPNAYIRPLSIIGAGARIGFGAEIKASVIRQGAKVTHQAYVGNSIIGANADIGAGVSIATKRFDHENVLTTDIQGNPFLSAIPKLGAFVGEGCKIGVGSVVMPGTVIQKSIVIWPKSVVKGFVKSNVVQLDTAPSKFDFLNLLLENHYKENSLFWRRGAVFVSISGAMFAVLGFSELIRTDHKRFFTFILALFGLLISLAWVQVAVMGQYYCIRVARDIEELISKSNELHDKFKWSLGEKKECIRPKGIKSTSSMIVVALISVVLWLAIGLFSFLEI